MASFKYRGLVAFARTVGNVLHNLRRMGQEFSPGGNAEKQATKAYAEALDKFVKENLSGKEIPLSKKSLKDKELSDHTSVKAGGAGRGTKAISIRITGTTKATNMIGRGVILDEGGMIKAKTGRFLAIPLGREVKKVRDYSKGTTFQIYKDKALRGQRVTKRFHRLAPRYLMLRGPGREFTPIYLFVTRIKVPSYKWIQDASKRARAVFEKDMPARVRAFHLFSRKKSASVNKG